MCNDSGLLHLRDEVPGDLEAIEVLLLLLYYNYMCTFFIKTYFNKNQHI